MPSAYEDRRLFEFARPRQFQFFSRSFRMHSGILLAVFPSSLPSSSSNAPTASDMFAYAMVFALARQTQRQYAGAGGRVALGYAYLGGMRECSSRGVHLSGILYASRHYDGGPAPSPHGALVMSRSVKKYMDLDQTTHNRRMHVTNAPTFFPSDAQSDMVGQ
ncbi:hypothetical protein BDU57DRAFT_520054, partial [Ampelomyces quisqualis]